MIDQHFSSRAVADQLAACVEPCAPLVVFDPAVGDGSLLEAITRVAPSSSLIGADIDPAIVKRLRCRHPQWTVSLADALSPRSRSASHAWQRASSEDIDYVVVNPPFSFRGYGGVTVEYAGETSRATPASAFVALCLEKVRPIRGLIAVLPAGTLAGERDRELWQRIRENWVINVVGQLPRGSFSGVAASSQVVSLTPGSTTPATAASGPVSRVQSVCSCVDVVRGRVPVARHESSPKAEGGEQWIHTSLLRDHVVQSATTGLGRDLATVGPFVVLPRVGKFYVDKIAEFDGERAVLSDCTYGVRPVTLPIQILLDDIDARSAELAVEYVGTGAPHITFRRLVEFLRRLGYNPRRIPASVPSAPCTCAEPRSVELPPSPPVLRGQHDYANAGTAGDGAD